MRATGPPIDEQLEVSMVSVRGLAIDAPAAVYTDLEVCRGPDVGGGHCACRRPFGGLENAAGRPASVTTRKVCFTPGHAVAGCPVETRFSGQTCWPVDELLAVGCRRGPSFGLPTASLGLRQRRRCAQRILPTLFVPGDRL
jgi:hypothetical protein